MHCKSNRCDVCNCVIPSSSLTSHTTKRSYNINHQLDCNSNIVVYLRIEGANMVEEAYRKLKENDELKLKWQECFNSKDCEERKVRVLKKTTRTRLKTLSLFQQLVFINYELCLLIIL